LRVGTLTDILQRRLLTFLVTLTVLTAALAAGGLHSALAWSATGTLTPNGSGAGTGFATTTSGPRATVQVTLQNGTPSAIYVVYSCLALVGGDFDCVGRNNPTGLQTVVVAPQALAPVSVGLVQQGTLLVDSSGSGSTTIFLGPLLLPDTPHSIYNVVQVVNQANPTESYTALDLQTPAKPVAGVTNLPLVTVTTVIGVPVYVLAPFPGYAFPVALTALNGVPFVPFFTIPQTAFFGPSLNFFVGTCPNGLPAAAVTGTGGQFFLVC